MNWFLKTFTYSIGKKIIMSLTGLFLVIFLIAHLASNLLLFVNDGGLAFNENSHYLTQNIFIRIVEILMFLSFFFHIIDGVALTIQNRRARKVRYAVSNSNANSMWSARNMIISGIVVFAFLIVHLKTFFVPYRISGLEDGVTLYDITKAAFENPWYSLFYIIAMALLGMHLHHGFASGFQTIGLRHPKYYSMIKQGGVILSVIICATFAAIPIYFLLMKYMNQ
ncbi:MAG: succinate dehydrogenase cytochrome b subunit [Bacteroidota bacterium]|nr:succinate dehydrogenase cytochrome b subunit [Bacteroidota bacterium]